MRGEKYWWNAQCEVTLGILVSTVDEAVEQTIDIITATLKGDPSRTHSPDNCIDRECDYTISWHDYIPWMHRPQRTCSEGYYTIVLFFVVLNLTPILLYCCCSALS